MRKQFTEEDKRLVAKKVLPKAKRLGLAEGKNEIAKKMKDEGLDVELILKMTGLSEEEIEAL